MRRLNEKEEPIMQVLWRLQRAFVKEIVAELEPPVPPVTTVSSIVRKLEKEGFVPMMHLARPTAITRWSARRRTGVPRSSTS